MNAYVQMSELSATKFVRRSENNIVLNSKFICDGNLVNGQIAFPADKYSTLCAQVENAGVDNVAIHLDGELTDQKVGLGFRQRFIAFSFDLIEVKEFNQLNAEAAKNQIQQRQAELKEAVAKATAPKAKAKATAPKAKAEAQPETAEA